MPEKPARWKRLRKAALRAALLAALPAALLLGWVASGEAALRAALLAALPAALLLGWVASGAFTGNSDADCIFVPGAAIRPGRKPSDALRYRLERALELYRAGRAPLIVVAGGGEGDYAEAEVMAEWLEKQGVPPAAIIRETQSGTTRQNMKFSAPLMRKAGIQSAIVCTQWFHARRAALCLSQEGFEATPQRCGGNTLLREPYFVCREMAALPLHALKLDPGA